MNTDTNQIALLIATVQQLSSKIDKMEAVAVGVTDKTILNWLKDDKFPKETYCRKRRGKYYIYKFDKTLAVKVAEKLRRGEFQ